MIKPNPLKVDDVLYSSWGYEQTNITYYRVVKATDKSVSLVEMPVVRGPETSFMTNMVEPDLNATLNSKPIRRLVKGTPDSPCVRISSFEFASKWDGRPRRESHYA